MRLSSKGESELVPHWLRSHGFAHGLFGRKSRGGDAWFLGADQTEALARQLGQVWREAHLAGKLLPCRWDLQPVYSMLDTEMWDDACRTALDRTLQDDLALDSFTLMLFGAHFSTERQTIAKICNYDAFIERVQMRLHSEPANGPHESVRVALQKA